MNLHDQDLIIRALSALNEADDLLSDQYESSADIRRVLRKAARGLEGLLRSYKVDPRRVSLPAPMLEVPGQQATEPPRWSYDEVLPPGFYFYSESWSEVFGPFPSKEEAEVELAKYSKSL